MYVCFMSIIKFKFLTNLYIIQFMNESSFKAFIFDHCCIVSFILCCCCFHSFHFFFFFCFIRSHLPNLHSPLLFYFCCCVDDVFYVTLYFFDECILWNISLPLKIQEDRMCFIYMLCFSFYFFFLVSFLQFCWII